MSVFTSTMLREIEAATSSTIGVQDLTLATSGIINLVAKQGKRVSITNRGNVVAMIVPARDNVNRKTLDKFKHYKH